MTRGDDHDYQRVEWFYCACCPPNVMRILASLQHYVLLGGEARAVLHQYMTGRYAAAVAGGEVWLEVTTDYPWEGTVTIRVSEAPVGRWSWPCGCRTGLSSRHWPSMAPPWTLHPPTAGGW